MTPVARDAYYREIAQLRAENETLREQIRQAAVDRSAKQYAWPWRLSPRTARLLDVLYAAPAGRVLRHDSLKAAVWGDADHSSNILSVYIWKLRSKLPAGIVIDLHWGVGYSLSPASRARLDEVVAALERDA
jgi:DNA-binding response OmpR family regulator